MGVVADREACLATAVAKPVAESSRAEGLACCRDEEGHLSRGVAVRTDSRAGWIGIQSEADVFCCMTAILPSRTCCQPMRMTSERRCAVYRSSENARRSREP